MAHARSSVMRTVHPDQSVPAILLDSGAGFAVGENNSRTPPSAYRMSDSIINSGEKVFIIHRQQFPRDARHHFFGVDEARVQETWPA